MGAEDYQGGRMASAITSYALSKLDEYGIEPEVWYTAAAAVGTQPKFNTHTRCVACTGD